MLFSNRFGHKFEKAMAVSGDQDICKFPIHLELAIGVLMVVLIRTPSQIEHIVANLTDHIIAPHHRLLIIARLGCRIKTIGDLVTLGGQQEKLGLDPSFNVHTHRCGIVNESPQDIARCLLDIFAVHHAIARHPSQLGFPRQLNHRRGIRNRQHVGMCRGHVQPSGKAGKTRSLFLHLGHRLCRDQLCTLSAKEVGKRDHKVFNAVFHGKGC